MQNPATRLHHVSDRDFRILEHVARHRITTNRALHALFFPNHRLNAVTKVTARLCRLRLLNSHLFYHPKRYFTLGPIGAQRLGRSVRSTYPLGAQALPTEYGVLAFSVFSIPTRLRLSRSELAQQFPWIPASLATSPYCRTPTLSPLELDLIRVDLGGMPNHVARKCVADIDRRNQIAGFQRLIADGCFRLVIVTATGEKAASIRFALDQHLWAAGLRFHLVVVPELLLILGEDGNAT